MSEEVSRLKVEKIQTKNSAKTGGFWKYNKLANLITAGLFVYAGVILSNHFWYKYNIPNDFQNAKWEGEFVSVKHPTSGKLLAQLPDPIPRDREFEFEAVVYYNIWSGFLTGKIARADFIGYLNSQAPITSGEETRQSVIPRHFSFFSKGGATPFPKDIRYTATIDRDDQYFAGSYSAQNGYDVGHFSLKKH